MLNAPAITSSAQTGAATRFTVHGPRSAAHGPRVNALYSNTDAMNPQLMSYFLQRPENSPFLLTADLERSLTNIFEKPDWLLPRPYKIFFEDETTPPVLGFPVLYGQIFKEIDQRIERWIGEEIRAQLKEDGARERARQAFGAYVSGVMKIVENAMLSNLLADYHGAFWLAHSGELARHFQSIPKKLGAIDTQAARSQSDAVRFRIYTKWATEMREQMSRMGERMKPILDGEEERGLWFFRILQDNVLIFTEEFISPDLRELKSFFGGYLHRDFFAFKETFDRLLNYATQLVTTEAAFRNVLPIFGLPADQGVPVSLVLDRRFQEMLISHPTVQNLIGREEREQLRSISRRLQEYSALSSLRRGITPMTQSADGETLPLDRRSGIVYSRSTRPIDFGRPGVVDPMVHRFGLMYDISAFSQTLGDVAKTGQKGEFSAYRQMLLFQKKLSTITDRHVLQFEKFLGDGAFYTTRRAARLVYAAVEIQRFYADMRRKGFAFNKGLRIALNYGYYRLLPLKGTPDSTEHVIEFYGPGIVELSRLTTGKATKEVEEIQTFLVAHGYDQKEVQRFFAPLSSGSDLVDKEMEQREFFAYVNTNGHLANEGIVGSMAMAAELSQELTAESHLLYRLESKWGTYIGYRAAISAVEFVGVRLIGNVKLKGLDKVEIVEFVGFEREEVKDTRAEEGETLYALLRQEYHQGSLARRGDRSGGRGTAETRVPVSQLFFCVADGDGAHTQVYMGDWDPSSDTIRRCVRIAAVQLEFEIGVAPPYSTQLLKLRKKDIFERYATAGRDSYEESVPLAPLRAASGFRAFMIGETVEAVE